MTADRIRIWLTVAVLGILMLGSFWVYEVMRRNGEDLAAGAKTRSEPDYFVEQFNFVRLSQSGKTTYRITGDKLTHFPLEDEFEILQPRIVGIDQQQTPMNMRADRAVVKQKVQVNSGERAEDQIHLHGNVVVDRAESEHGIHLNLQTAYLMLLPDSEKMSTDKEIKLKTPYSQVSALGMRAENVHQKIELLGKVRVIMDIRPPNATEKNPVPKSSATKT